MSRQIVFKDKDVLSSLDEKIITDIIQETSFRRRHLLDSGRITVNVWARSASNGVRGSAAPCGTTIAILVNPEDPIYNTQPEELAATIDHEDHHAFRFRAGHKHRTTGQSLVFEGLAQMFEMECGYPRPLCSRIYDGKEQEFLSLVNHMKNRHALTASMFVNSQYHWRTFLLGQNIDGTPYTGPAPFKQWGAYGLGFALVNAWLAYKNGAGGKRYTAANSYALSERIILRDWLEGKFYLAAETIPNTDAVPKHPQPARPTPWWVRFLPS